MKSKLILSCVVIVLISLTGCSKPPANVGAFPEHIVRSNEFVRPGPGGKHLYWNNNGGIIYVQEQQGEEGLFPKKEYYLHEWTEEGNSIKLRDEQVAFSCFDGTNQITQTIDGKFFGGSYDSPQEASGAKFLKDAKDKRLTFEPRNCSFEKRLEKLSKDFYLFLGDFGSVELKWKFKNPTPYFINSKNQRIAKLKDFPITSKKVRYLHFIDRYLILDFPNLKHANIQWQAHNCLNGYLLSRDGEYSKFCIPEGPWVGGDIDVVLSNNGILLAAKSANPGLYWIKDEMYHLIVDGSIRDVEVGIDGCSVAAVHQFNSTRSGGKLPGELIKFNICNFNME